VKEGSAECEEDDEEAEGNPTNCQSTLSEPPTSFERPKENSYLLPPPMPPPPSTVLFLTATILCFRFCIRKLLSVFSHIATLGRFQSVPAVSSRYCVIE
jgi:hypothetical protein